MSLTFLQASGGGSNFLFIIGMFAIFFLFIILPQIKKTKKEKKFQQGLKKGMKVITTSGMHGKIMELRDATVTLETPAGKIRFERSSISLEATARLNADAKKK